MEVGESWAYRARQSDPLVEVRVVRVGERRPVRVLVRFVGEEFEGREEWVPPARLKVAWSQADEFVAREARWAAVIAASPVRDTAEHYAASSVFDTLIDRELATLGYRDDSGVASIHDVEGLAQFLDVEVAKLRGDPLAFVDGGALVVPWTITERIVRRAIEREPEKVLRQVDKDEAEQREKMLHGEWWRSSVAGEFRHLEASYFVEADEEPYNRPCRELLRRWCRAEAVERHDELVELRKEVVRLAQLVRDAVATLRDAGQGEAAGRVERELGVSVEELRRR